MKALAEAPADTIVADAMLPTHLQVEPETAASAAPAQAARKARAGRRAARRAIQAVDEVIIIEAIDAEARTVDPVLQQAVGDVALREPDAPANAPEHTPSGSEPNTEEPEDNEDPETPLPEMPLIDANEPGPVVTIDDFEDVFMRYQTPLANFVFHLVGNREQAYDLVQDVFVKAYRAFAGGTKIQEGALKSWLYKIANNTATDWMRRRRLINWLPLSLFNEDRGVGAGMPGTQPPDLRADAQAFHNAIGGSVSSYDGSRFENRIADREVIQTVLDELPPKFRVPLLLYEHEGLSVGETAEILKLTPSAVKMRLKRGRERFIELYKAETGERLTQFFQPRRVRRSRPASALRIALQP